MTMTGNYLIVSQQDLETLFANPEGIKDFLSKKDDEAVDVGIAWHAIHYALTGHLWAGEIPFRNAVLGGKEIGKVDVGFGPARGLTKEEVKAVNAGLAPIDAATFKKRFDARVFNENDIYPETWKDEDVDAVAEEYLVVKGVFEKAAVSDKAMVLYLN